VVGKNAEPTFRQRKLGEALRVLRERAGLTQQEAAHRLRYDHRKLSRIENGQRPEYHGLRAMLDEYGLAVSDWQPYLDMYERAIEKGWWHPYGVDDHGYISLEHDACMVREFQLAYVPGLLQTEEYIRAVFAGIRVQRSRKWVDNQVLVRLRRQERLLGNDNPLQFHTIIAESAFAQADRAQLARIIERAALQHVEVQVLRNGSGLHDGHMGHFALLNFPDARDPQVLYLEHAVGSLHVEDPEKVKASRLVYSHLSKIALTPDESATWIGRLAAER
jgi:transcriptional regulator with XRE-family HTH domain